MLDRAHLRLTICRYGISLGDPGATEHSTANRQSYKRRPHDLDFLLMLGGGHDPSSFFTDGTWQGFSGLFDRLSKPPKSSSEPAHNYASRLISYFVKLYHIIFLRYIKTLSKYILGASKYPI
jgi:hypothetical protein